MNQNDSNMRNYRFGNIFNGGKTGFHSSTEFYCGNNNNNNIASGLTFCNNSTGHNFGVNDSASQTNPQPAISPSELRRAISSTQQFFFNHQHPDGYWVAELEGDALLQSETILLLAFLGEEDSELAKQCAVHLLDTQLPDGGWGMYTGSKSDVNNTVKAYFALKITGHPANADYMQRARVRALELGGVDGVNSFTRFYLAILGQIPHNVCPAVPPQMMLLPKWSPINIYSISAWSRTIFVPLSIVSALAPVRELPHERGIKEIFIKTPDKWGALVAPGKTRTTNPFSWDFFFRCCNSMMWACRKFGLTPLRKRGIESAKQWTLEHCKNSDGPGAIYPPIIWGWIAFKSLGYSDDSVEIKYFRDQLNSHIIRNEKRGSIRIQPCKSPVWDTALTLKALMLGGLNATNPAVRKGLQWIRSRHIKQDGDWSNNTKIKSGVSGWCFEFNNAFYPDSDDTAMALMVLAGRFDEAKAVVLSESQRIMLSEIRDTTDADGNVIESGLGNHGKAGMLPPELRLTAAESSDTVEGARLSMLDIADTTAALESGLSWLLSMQNKDGGWGAFDRGNNREFLCKVPFADHNAMIDPSTPDLTGRVMESLGRLGFRVGKNVEVDRVVSYIRREQNADGSWFGRWGVNYIYGTWQAITGLTSVGVLSDDLAVVSGADWLLSHQHPSGGWGESPDSYSEPSLRGHGTPTASQTAWALMGLIAAGKQNDDAVRKGIRFLLDRQREDGTWYEPEFTGTGFPMVFYLKYHYYSVYFPLMALSLYAAKAEISNSAACEDETILKLQRIRIFSPEKEFYNNARPNENPEQNTQNIELKNMEIRG
ncbi:MAG: squalene--hopene cyclase [Planctomycetaceae bacterium]|jgi:squalene-hopene/tetraprenyl-beta-curcumene cyclase|nr:squalene--hopene cyclase [Planctomycetaceae bacterium]